MITRIVFDQLRRQDGWKLDSLDAYQLVLVGNGRGITRTLALAAARLGHKEPCPLRGACRQRISLQSFLRSDAPPWQGDNFHPCPSRILFPPEKRGTRKVWIIDAGDEGNERITAGEGIAFFICGMLSNGGRNL